MKKLLLYLVALIFAFLCALVFIFYAANPTTKFSSNQGQLEWHGHVENEFGTYNGSLIGDLFNGEGSFSFLSGEVYAGDWKNSYMDGQGSLVFPDIGRYTGELRNSMRSGQGVFSWDSGETYNGSWIEDKMTGSGSYTFASGAVLTGVFQNNHPVSGTLSFKKYASGTDPDTKIVSLEYTFSNTESNIVFTTRGGLHYDGDIAGIFKSGSATVRYPSGNTYTGNLVKGLRSGTGRYEWKDDNGKTLSYYDGIWIDNHMNGKGKYHYSASEYPYLEGNYENDIPTGILLYYNDAGHAFNTEWKKGKCISVKEKK